MSDIVTPKDLGPRIVSFAELQAVLMPLALGYAWGEAAIRDLWLLGAPIPNDMTKRILLPNQFMEWFEDVQARQGLNISLREVHDSLPR